MYETDRRKIRKTLFEVIENQMKANNPPETKETYQRLRGAGYSRKETMKVLACVVLKELNDMVKENRTFDEAGYIQALKALPQLPWEWEEEPEDCA
jgi:hypothetical protein